MRNIGRRIIGNPKKCALLMAPQILTLDGLKSNNTPNLNFENSKFKSDLDLNPNSISKYSKLKFLAINVGQDERTLTKETFDDQINKEFKGDTNFIVRKLVRSRDNVSYYLAAGLLIGSSILFGMVIETFGGFLLCFGIYCGVVTLYHYYDATTYTALNVPKNKLYNKILEFMKSANHNDCILIQEFIELQNTDKCGIIYINGNRTETLEVDNIYDKLKDETYNKYNSLIDPKSNSLSVPVLFSSKREITDVPHFSEAEINKIKDLCEIDANTGSDKTETNACDQNYAIYWCQKADNFYIIQIKCN